jgi:methyl-accepting chemotaxis protein
MERPAIPPDRTAPDSPPPWGTMKHLKIWQKLALLAAVFMIPFLVVTWQLLATVDQEGVQFARQERAGLDAALPLLGLGQELQRHRTLATRVDGGRAAALQASGARVQDAVRAVDAQAYADVIGERWAQLRRRVGVVTEPGPGQRGGAAAASEHDVLVQETAALARDLADQSRLTLDPERDTYYLIDLLLVQAPALGDLLSRAQALASSITAAGRATPAQAERLRELDALIDIAARNLGQSVDKAMSFNPALRPQLQGRAEAVAADVRRARVAIGTVVVGGDAGQAVAAPSVVVPGGDSVAALHAAAAPALAGLLDARVTRYEQRMWEIFGWAALAVVLVLVIGIVIVRDITVPLRQVVGVADQIAVGNLNVDAISSDRGDEIGKLARAFGRMITSLREQVLLVQDIAGGDLSGSIKPASANDDMGNALQDMVEHLSALVSEVHKSGIQVNTSATQISATAREQHSTASEIAATTTQIGATSKEISATSKELVRTMNEVASAAEQSATLAGSGQVGLTQMEETMQRVMEATGSINAKLAVLNEKAGNITQVVTTITRVADQTNLLSLNAAIEAEKAGEYGRGFSVVATEIRRLADQTAVATYDIEQMVKEIQSAVSAGVMGMDKFSEEVRRGMDEVGQVGAQLSQIIHQVQHMAPRCEAASEGMRAQATGAEQITQALSQLSEAALQTVESLRQSNQAIDGLHQSATGLREGVSRFKLGA